MKLSPSSKQYFLAGCFITLLVVAMFPILKVTAEQFGNTPESGVISRIKSTYDALITLSYGSDDPGSWGDWGVFWNRIKSAAEWTPDATVTADKVASGETFYGNSRTLGTGTGQMAMDYSLLAHNPYSSIGDSGYSGGESDWTQISSDVWKDNRTGLYWSKLMTGTFDNNFSSTHSDCPFFDGSNSTEMLAAKKNYDGLTLACGSAINLCGSLSLDADGDSIQETDWYLPSEKEFLQAYIDGMFRKTGSAFTGYGSIWTSTENSDDSRHALVAIMAYGYFWNDNKTTLYNVRCVTRD